MRNVHLLNCRTTVGGQDGRTPLPVKDPSPGDVDIIETGMMLQSRIQMDEQSGAELHQIIFEIISEWARVLCRGNKLDC